MSKYLISISQDKNLKSGTIHDPESKLKVKAFDMVKSTFEPQRGEVSYYVTAGGETIAFETKGYNRHRKLLVLQMIAWYCLYLGLIEAQIHASWPAMAS